jgi:hypothetical protein
MLDENRSKFYQNLKWKQLKSNHIIYTIFFNLISVRLLRFRGEFFVIVTVLPRCNNSIVLFPMFKTVYKYWHKLTLHNFEANRWMLSSMLFNQHIADLVLNQGSLGNSLANIHKKEKN